MVDPTLNHLIVTPLTGHGRLVVDGKLQESWVCRLNEYPNFPYWGSSKEEAISKAADDLRRRFADLKDKVSMRDDFLKRTNLKLLSREEAESGKKGDQLIIEI